MLGQTHSSKHRSTHVASFVCVCVFVDITSERHTPAADRKYNHCVMNARVACTGTYIFSYTLTPRTGHEHCIVFMFTNSFTRTVTRLRSLNRYLSHTHIHNTQVWNRLRGNRSAISRRHGRCVSSSCCSRAWSCRHSLLHDWLLSPAHSHPALHPALQPPTTLLVSLSLSLRLSLTVCQFLLRAVYLLYVCCVCALLFNKERFGRTAG